MRRSKLEIYAEVLQAINEGCHKPTRIMYKCNLSWVPLMKALNFLKDIEALKEKNEGERSRYYVTEKGREILRQYKQLAIILKKN